MSFDNVKPNRGKIYMNLKCNFRVQILSTNIKCLIQTLYDYCIDDKGE